MLERLLNALGFRRSEKVVPPVGDPAWVASFAAAPSAPLLAPTLGEPELSAPRRGAGKPSLFLPWTLPISVQLEKQIREDVARLSPRPPTDDQWKMILSTAPCTYVNAGAGSGKSTTLVQRLLVLHKYLGVPLSNITVFSFTKASTADFRAKLIQELELHGIHLDKKGAERVVRTFHSKLLEFGKAEGRSIRIFDQLGSPGSSAPAGSAEARDLDDAGFADLGWKPEQEEFLREAFERRYAKSASFRRRLKPLYREYLRGLSNAPPRKDYEDWQIANAAKVDHEVTTSLQRVFEGGPSAPIPLKLNPLETDLTFHANAYLPELDTYVIYVPGPSVLGDRCQDRVNRLPLAKWLIFKCTILGHYGTAKIRMVESQAEFNRLLELDASLVGDPRPDLPAPVFDYELEGEKRLKIWRSLFAAGSFAEGLAVDPADLVTSAQKMKGTEREFVQLLAEFWQELTEVLEENKLVRYGTLFRRYSEHEPVRLAEVPEPTLRSMTHVLIDEFQDISPEVVGWIRGVLLALRDKGVETSLLCVGDDYQSIYGWKGSSPHYFLNFEDEFRSTNTLPVTMEENFRSGQVIIDRAERVLEGIPPERKRPKRGRSRVRTGPGTVSFVPNEDPEAVLTCILEYVKVACATLPPDKLADKEKPPVLVLARTNKVGDDIERQLARRARNALKYVRFLTYHRSKGLEAPYCVLVGDCNSEGVSPFRNLVYSMAGFDGSYDTAQRDEALRLAYVGVTRAALACTWFAEAKAGGGYERASGGSL